MNNSKYIHKPALKFINTLILFLPFVIIWFIYYEPKTMTSNSKQSSVLMLFTYVVILYMTSNRLDGFKYTILRGWELIVSQILAVATTDVIGALIIWMMSIHFPNLLPGFLCFCVQMVIAIPTVVLIQQYYFRIHKPLKTIVVYDVRQGMDELIQKYRLEKRFHVCATFPVEDILYQMSLLDGNEVVLLCGIHSTDRNIILKACVDRNIVVYLIPRVGDVIMSGAERMHMLHLPILRVKRYSPSTEYRVIKRVFDLVVSSLLIVILSPVFLVVSLLVKKDGGPAFYKQNRLTKDGKQFEIIKFRSMRVDAEKNSGPVLSAGDNDQRITKVGHFIRSCRIDEIPQLINIFKGDMSFVGPRPERPEIASEYERDMPEFRLRLQAKAGLTGYAQVFGKYNTTPYDKLLMDLMYIAHPSIIEDVLIMLSTVRILFVKDSTEGVSLGSLNAIDGSYQPDRRKNSNNQQK